MTNGQKKPVLGYILKGYPRISETFISNEILLLERLGFTIRLFPMRHPRENFCHASVKQIQARVDYLPTELFLDFPRLIRANIFLAVKQPTLYKKTLAAASKRFQRSRNLATAKHLFQAGYLSNNFLGHASMVDHLHGHFAHSPTSVTFFASLLSGLPYSFTAHAKDIYTSNPEQLKEKIDHADFVVTCTRYNKSFLGNLASGLATPIHCIYHGIDLQLFDRQPVRPQTSSPANLLTIARMTEKKGLPTIYEALRILVDRGISIRHTLIGDGDDREKVEALISRLDLIKHCRCLGTQTHERVVQEFKQSDCFVLGCEIARNGDRDGIPNVLVESLAMGVPAVSTTVSAIPEILLNNQTGITVTPKDPLALANAIQKILQDQKLRTILQQKGRKHVEQNFDNRQWISKLAEIFQHKTD